MKQKEKAKMMPNLIPPTAFFPLFFFIRDPLDYFPTLHHTNQDIYDHCVPEDLVQSAVVMASFVYFAAMRDEMLPRKPLPIPVDVK